MVGLLAFSPSEMEAVRSFPLWSDPKFALTFVAAATMGSILNYSTFLCTINNSALTTTVIGCLKVRAWAGIRPTDQPAGNAKSTTALDTHTHRRLTRLLPFLPFHTPYRTS